MNKIQKALNKAYELHDDDKRKGTDVPYFVHIVDTMKYLMYETKDEDIICAGILHDTLEDTNYFEEELKNEFGEKVYSLVKFCTELGNTPDANDDQQKKSWKRRKQHSIDSLEKCSVEEALVFVADKVSNLLSMKEELIIGNELWNRFNSTKEEIKWYYTSIYEKVKDKLKGRRILKLFENLKVFPDVKIN